MIVWAVWVGDKLPKSDIDFFLTSIKRHLA